MNGKNAEIRTTSPKHHPFLDLLFPVGWCFCYRRLIIFLHYSIYFFDTQRLFCSTMCRLCHMTRCWRRSPSWQMVVIWRTSA